jgi:alanyl-tRNA synthetase
MADLFRKKAKSAAILLASDLDGKITLISAMTEDLVARGGHAGNWVKLVAAICSGTGGGKPIMGQAGGKDVTKLPLGLTKAVELVKGMMK